MRERQSAALARLWGLCLLLAPLAGRAQDAGPPDEPATAAEAPAADTVKVIGRSAGTELRRSAAAVKVVELKRAHEESADLGEVLARSGSVSVRRSGGLGASSRFTLNGLGDNRVRFLLDGLPLHLSGLGVDVANIPVNFIERVEVYRGVVPVRFGADALGGAINFVTDTDFAEDRASACWQVGSYGTHRVAVGAQRGDDGDGWVARANGFFDVAENDYPVRVSIPDARGKLASVTVDRFHDAYRAYGAGLTAGLVHRPWADRLLLEVFGNHTDKELQHGATMITPYGEATTDTLVLGSTLRYAQGLSPDLDLDLAAGYAHRERDFVDQAAFVYNWRGEQLRSRPNPGEIGLASDRTQREDNIYGRFNLEWRPGIHALRLAVAPTRVRSAGEERRVTNSTGFDPRSAERDLFTLISGLEHGLTLFDERLETTVFGKLYVYRAQADEPVSSGGSVNRDFDDLLPGYGAALRFAPWTWAYAKLSYEHARRLPEPEEVFGDAAFVEPNLQLTPETSDNLNLELAIETGRTPVGAVRAGVNLFRRDAEDLILLLTRQPFFISQNAYAVRSEGFDAALGWTSPGRLVALDGNTTWMDLRNTSGAGQFAPFEGDRIPNQPYLFANGAARVDLRGLWRGDDCLTVGWNTRYVHEFQRTWESLGTTGERTKIAAQLVHAALLGYQAGERPRMTGAFEVQNLTGERTYDFYGVERPGRAYFLKVTAELDTAQ